MPKTLLGVENELAIPNLRAARLGKVTHAFEQMYRGSELYHEISKEAFDTVRLLEQVEKGRKGASRAHKYPHGRLGQSLRQIAMLIKADVGLEAAFAECDGWDTHIRQGASHGLLARMFSDLGAGLSAFFHDLGDRADDVVLVTMSEFGRTVAENATAGTDHGHGTCFLALGGNLSRGGVLGQWPGLAVEQRYEGRDLAVTTDYRDVLAEIIERHLGIDQPGTIFPGYSVSRDRYCNFLNT